MAHKHTCLLCGQVIEEGDFDCEEDTDHDWAQCDTCTDEIGPADIEAYVLD